MKFRLVILLCAISITTFSQKDSILFKSGNKKELTHDYAGAVIDWTKALKINPKFEEAYYKRAIAEVLNLQDYKAAINDFSKVIEIDPSRELAYVNRGQSEYALHALKYAIEDFSKAIELNPKNGYAYCSRAVAKFDAGDRQSVCADFNKAIELGYRQAATIKKDYCH